MSTEDKTSSRWLVSTQWLQDHLDAPDIVVLDGSYYLPAMKRNAREEYLAAHIPGAVFFDIDAVADHSSDLPHMLPSPEAFSSAMRQLGIGDGLSIVIYDGIGLFSAPRVWWTLRTFGVREVFILDGGMPKWKAEGRPIDFGEVRRTPRHFTARFNRGAVADVEDVKKALAHPDIQVVDARSAGRFHGTAPEPRPGLKSGHMPGALNLPYDTLLEDGKLIAPHRISAKFADAGIYLDRPVVTSCGSGVTAAVLWFALDALGKQPKSLYDGSWTEWASRGDLPIDVEIMQGPDVTGFYHEATGSIAYLVADPETGRAAIIDPVLDFNLRAGRVSTSLADGMLEAVASRKLNVEWILDIYPHADHFSAVFYLKSKLGAPIAIGEKVAEVQKLWQAIYNLPPYRLDYWDKLFADGERFRIGSMDTSVMLSPGHTLASITYLVGDAAFVHDTLFQPDSGTARTDFPGGNAGTLYDSIQRILTLPDDTRLFTGHDYRPNGLPAVWGFTVAQQKRDNTHVGVGRDRESYVTLRQARDKTLPLPDLMLSALQVNLRGGRLPEAESNGRSYLKIPVGAF